MAYKRKSSSYKRKSSEEVKKEVQTLLDGGLSAIKQFSSTPEERLELLDFMKDFYHYSTRNQALILSQFKGAYGVGTYNFFKEKGFHVNKGEKAIKILRPAFYRMFKDEEGKYKLESKATAKEKELLEKGALKSWEVREYRPTPVFDITQTNAQPEDYPKLFPNKRQTFDYDQSLDLDVVNRGVQKIANALNIQFETEETSHFRIESMGTAKGQFRLAKNGHKEIVLNHRNTPTENIAVSIHELAHAYMHNSTESNGLQLKQEELTTSLEEFQAEMVSYIVSQHVGIDTKEETIPYIAGWTDHLNSLEEQGKDVQFELLDNVQKASRVFIELLEEELTPHREYLAMEKFKEKNGLMNDRAFSDEQIISLMGKDLSDNELCYEIDSLRKEALVDWAFNGAYSPEEIQDYQEDMALNLKGKVIDGHLFYQVDERVEIMLSPGKEGDMEWIQLDKVGDITTYSFPDKEAASAKLQALGAFSVPSLPGLKQFLSQDREVVREQERTFQKHLINNRVMRETYQEETGRSM